MGANTHPNAEQFSGEVDMGGVTTMTYKPASIDADDLKSTAGIARTQLAEEVLVAHPIPWTAWRVWNAYHTNLPGTAASDDLALIGGTFATAPPTIQAGDLKAAGATNRYARCGVALGEDYDDAGDVKIRVHGGMKTTVSDTTCTLDFVVYENNKEEGLSADLCTTLATNINVTAGTYNDYDFVVTSTSFISGDILDIRMHIACNDAATGTAVIPFIGYVAVLYDTRG